MNFIVYGVIALVVVTAVGGTVYSYNHAIARAEKAEAALADCTAKYDQALKTIEKQNKAVEGLIDAEKKATDRARIARQAAAKAQVSTQAERNRLAALQQGSGGISCTEAVRKSKEGLRP